VKQVVGVAEMKLSADPEDSLVTYALGSCLGITVHDPVARVGGMLHVMLPLSSSIDTAKAALNPAMFVDTGVPRLFRESYRLGARKERLVVKVAGGASARDNEEDDHFQIGRNNLLMLRKMLWKKGVFLEAEDVGGRLSRTMSLDISTGSVVLTVEGRQNRL
jgi:chemotaxis protein CheD